MHFDFVSQPAEFLERPNRFRVVARLHESGEVISAHCPNPGRLRELLIPGATVHVSKAVNPKRKTPYDLRFVNHPSNGVLVSLDTRLPNDIAEEGVRIGAFPQFADYANIEREVVIEDTFVERETDKNSKHKIRSRFDFRLSSDRGERLWVEVKSVSLVERRMALFPDAPTERGTRHLEELIDLVQLGERAAVLFIVQRGDADEIRAQWETDPKFAQKLAQAQEAGVALYGYTCRLTKTEVHIDRQIPVVTHREV